MKRTDDNVQLVAFRVNSFCAECANENFQHGHVNCCPLRRGPPAREEKIMAKLNKERTRDWQAWMQYILGLHYIEGRMGLLQYPKVSILSTFG